MLLYLVFRQQNIYVSFTHKQVLNREQIALWQDLLLGLILHFAVYLSVVKYRILEV